ncbi:tRNA-nucleotidyltransferase 1, mitochondrial [Trachymyrmex zeteki]|uniref:tRNA-nucleotidyltransferase 1, mitochondrial n=1 Tax=Mycetomoellerius zeteki TaxID=64791 RepID=A0A151X6P4_9HYME|nr:PREDICTED: CCA tRNA nucleotidyltransferase 1, mitochondrial isoform X1 [Trachymyrmex zeteki]KYQ56083.1 tRNA-nucleotidyltransferase 1, mitochondrial [Trachymyrmex zeteki]
MLNTLAQRTINLLCRDIITVRKYGLTRRIHERVWRKTRMDDQPPSRVDPVVMKLDSPYFRSIFTPELEKLASLFKKHNYELRIAGGAVRDILMDKQPKDLDFATDATPQQMKDMFTNEEIRMINEKGERHGTITARINDMENFEITTLRIDVLTDGRHAQVEFTKDWKLDANRRDLTINSMFLDLDGRVYDYFYGYDDLKKKKIVFVGEASVRIQEDYLRILRYFRFYGRIMDIPNQHDEATITALKENIGGLKQISGERIWSEWNKILSGTFALELTLKLLECGSSRYIGLPEEPDVENFRKVYERAQSNKVTLKPISLIVSMLKDEYEVIKLHERLKLSNSDRDLAIFLVQHRKCKPCEKPLKPYQQLVLLQQIKRYDILKEDVKELLRYCGAMQLLDEFEQWVIPKFPVNGSMLMKHVPVKKMIGSILIELKRIWIDADFKLTDDQLIKHVPSIVSELEEEYKTLDKEKNKKFKKLK